MSLNAGLTTLHEDDIARHQAVAQGLVTRLIILEADDPVAEEMAVAGLPERKVVCCLPARVGLVLLEHAIDQGTVGLRADRGAERMIQCLAVDAEALDALLGQPGAGLLIGAG